MSLLKAEDVAEILNTSTARIYELAREKLLPHVRLGRSIRVDPDALDEWIRGGGQALPGGWRREPLVETATETKDSHDRAP